MQRVVECVSLLPPNEALSDAITHAPQPKPVPTDGPGRLRPRTTIAPSPENVTIDLTTATQMHDGTHYYMSSCVSRARLGIYRIGSTNRMANPDRLLLRDQPRGR